MADSTLKNLGRLVARLLGVAVLVGAVVGVAWMGWQWQSHATVQRVAVTGAQHAPADTLRHLARVDTGMTMNSLSPRVIADRVTRHPWVQTVDVRLSHGSGTVELAVTERTPAALVMSASGRPAYYLDTTGYALPLVSDVAYDVPLVHGLTQDPHPTQPVAPAPLRETLQALARVDDTEALVAAVVMQGDDRVQLLTEPIGAHESLPVLVRPRDLPAQLRRLRAFARQVLATRPGAAVAEIDVRFDDQVVTRSSLSPNEDA